jgi:hypothetical protein
VALRRLRAEGCTLEMFEKFLERNRLQRKVVLSTPHFTSIPNWHRRFDENARIRWLRQPVHELFNDETDERKPQRRG